MNNYSQADMAFKKLIDSMKQDGNTYPTIEEMAKAFRNLHDTWLQYFHRTVIQKKLLNANVPDIPEDADGFGDIDPDDLNADGLVDTTPPEDTDEEE